MTMQSYRAAAPIDKPRLIDDDGEFTLLSNVIQTHGGRSEDMHPCSALLIDDGDEDDVRTYGHQQTTHAMHG